MMKLLSALLVITALLLSAPHAQEKVTLTAPVYTDVGATEFRPGSLYLNRAGSEIRAIFAEVEAGTTNFVPNGKALTRAAQRTR